MTEQLEQVVKDLHIGHLMLLNQVGSVPHELAMVGDRLYTDIAMAQRAGAFSVLVLTGETTAALASAHRPAPDLVVNDLAAFGARLREAHQQEVPI